MNPLASVLGATLLCVRMGHAAFLEALQSSPPKDVSPPNVKALSPLIDLTSELGPTVAAYNHNSNNKNRQIRLLAKAEFLNPGKSHKDRIAKNMLLKAEARGELVDRNGNKKTIIAASSGNTGHSLAMIGTKMGYEVIIITNRLCSEEKCANIRRNGATLWIAEELPLRFPDILGNTKDYMAQERILCQEHGDKFFSVNQYENLDNMAAHYESTAREIWEQTQGQVSHFVMAASTGGTIMGVGKSLKERSHGKIQVILSDPHKSSLAGFLEKARGDVAKGEKMLRRVQHAIQQEGGTQVEGAGKSELTKIMTCDGDVLKYVDEAISIHDFDAFDTCRSIAQNCGIMVGGSAGLNVAACRQIAEQIVDEGPEGEVLLTTLLCDHGGKYRSKIFNDEWFRSNDTRQLN